MGPVAILLLFDGLSVDSAGTEVGDCVEVVVKEERNVEPSEVTSVSVVATTGISMAVDDDDDGSVEVSEGENGSDDEGGGVGVGVDESDDEIESEGQKDP
jgi:hypothetical protein